MSDAHRRPAAGRRSAAGRRPAAGRRDGIAPLVMLAAAAAVPALLLWSLTRWADQHADAAESAVPVTAASVPEAPVTGGAEPLTIARLNTGLLSYRRSAQFLSLRLNLGAFEAGVAPLMSAVGDRSCAAISLDGRLIGAKNADLVVLPASNMKLVVAAAALEVLGSDYTYTTDVVGPAPVGGVVSGDVYLVGGGDPLLSGEWYPDSDLDRFPAFGITSLDELARRLVANGVTRIDGAVLGDGSRYDDEWFVTSGWGADVAGIEAGPYDALLANDSRVRGDDQRGSDPNQSAAREFVRILGEQGVTVTGGAGTGTAPDAAGALASVESLPIGAGAIPEMLTNSDNNTAELMVKEIGYVSVGAGTREAGTTAIVSTVAGLGIDVEGLVVADGSGLSVDNRISCSTLLAVLQHAGYESPVGQGLAIGGQTGTLADAFVDTSLAGRIRGKTGTLNNVPYDQDPPAVKALAGYLPVDGGGAIEYVLLLNGGIITDQSEYRPIWAHLVTALTSYPAIAGPSVLGPR